MVSAMLSGLVFVVFSSSSGVGDLFCCLQVISGLIVFVVFSFFMCFFFFLEEVSVLPSYSAIFNLIYIGTWSFSPPFLKE